MLNMRYLCSKLGSTSSVPVRLRVVNIEAVFSGAGLLINEFWLNWLAGGVDFWLALASLITPMRAYPL